MKGENPSVEREAEVPYIIGTAAILHLPACCSSHVARLAGLEPHRACLAPHSLGRDAWPSACVDEYGCRR